MQTIIAPTDFSDISLNAVNYAADMALALNANLWVLHAIDLPINVKGFYDEPNDYRSESELKLDDLKKDLIKRTGSKTCVQTKQVTGPIENEIIKICSYRKPLAVVMATHGANMKEHLFLESITVYLSKNLEFPLIVVPQNKCFRPVKKILLATGLERLYDLPVEKIIESVNAFQATLDIVHVYNNEDKFEVMCARISELTNYLKKINPQFHFIKNTNVYKGILDFAYKNSSDIILTFPKKHAFFHKSESKQLIFNAPFAVMAIH
jgi:nucleotide-binding universal stress UspA family protein